MIVARAVLNPCGGFSSGDSCASLSEIGFVVMHCGSHGVAFKGEAALFESIFGSSCPSIEPKVPEYLFDKFQTVYFPTKTCTFNRKGEK